MTKRFSGKAIFIYLGIYFVLNLIFLNQFPFMHSDESWLSGLSREMMHSGLDATEPFFDLLPRYPHAIKVLYHLMQMPFVLVFGYNLFSVRLISLIFGTALLYLFYRLARLLSQSDLKALIITVILSFDVQFVYASHFARQDIIITLGIVAVIYYMMQNTDAWRFKNDLIAGVITGVFIGIHPNSLMIALSAGALYLYYILDKTQRVRNLLVYIGTVACFACVFVALSYAFDPNFIPDYIKTGEALGVNLSFADKIRTFPQYFIKLFHGVSGTYYTPPLKLPFILFGIGIAASAVYAFFNKTVLKILLPIAAVCAGILLIGRYSQPAVILLFPLCYLLIFFMADSLIRRYQWIPALLVGAAVFMNTLLAAMPNFNHDYDDYISHIKAAVPSDSRVLANLNCEYAFDNGALLDVRNLEFLEPNGLKFQEYVESQGIEYIIYPQEMDYIYDIRPVWNILYGNLWPYYDDMQRFFITECEEVDTFTSPYAMRISGYMDDQDWTVHIYHVKDGRQP